MAHSEYTAGLFRFNLYKPRKLRLKFTSYSLSYNVELDIWEMWNLGTENLSNVTDQTWVESEKCLVQR
jgi:hypothetical protein